MPKISWSTSLISKFNGWRADRKRFPVTWLTYKRRVRDDVETLYKAKGGADFFTDEYVSVLIHTVEQLEARQLKLMTYQIAISAFMVLGLVSSEATVTLFGIPLKDAPGVKEILLVLASSIAIVFFAQEQSKLLRLTIVEKLSELKTDDDFVDFAKLAIKTPFDLRGYAAKQYNKWIFATIPTRLATGLIVLLLGAALLIYLVAAWALWVYVFVQIYRAPTLGLWSYIALLYGVIISAGLFFWLIRANFPFPYRDHRKLKQLRDLEKSNPAAYRALWNELYGER